MKSVIGGFSDSNLDRTVPKMDQVNETPPISHLNGKLNLISWIEHMSNPLNPVNIS